MKLTQEQIEEIRKRAEAASVGPWSYFEDDYSWDMYDGNYPMELKILKAPKMSREYAEYWPGKQDAEFIVNARQDIPALLAHIERLDAYIVHLGEQVESDKEVKSEYYNANKRLKQRIAELEKQNGKYSDALAEIEYRVNKYSIHSLENIIEGWDADD